MKKGSFYELFVVSEIFFIVKLKEKSKSWKKIIGSICFFIFFGFFGEFEKKQVFLFLKIPDVYFDEFMKEKSCTPLPRSE